MSWSLKIENIAGIHRGSADLHEGINAVRASNWRGKSSFLAAIRTAMGCETALTEGEDEGHVTLTADGDSYHVELSQQEGAVAALGTAYLEDEYDRTSASLFAFLDEDNEVRRAVRSDADLEPVLTRPLDLEEIDRKIADRREERDRIDRELERAREKASRLASLQKEVTSLEKELEELREKERNLATDGGDDREEKREELSELRAERERVRNLIERLRNSVDRTEKKLEDAYDELETHEVPDDVDLEAEIAEEMDALEEKEQERELLQSMYSVTERFLEEERLDLLTEVNHSLMGDSFECWICGSKVTEESARERMDALGERVVELREAIRDHRDRIEELKERRDEIRSARQRKEDIESEITTLESNLTEREENLNGAVDRLDAIEEQCAVLEDEVDEADEEVTDVRSEIKYREAELENTREEIGDCERAVERIETLEEQRAEIAEEVSDLKERKEQLRAELREEFDAAIDEVVERFDTSFETARLTSTFDLVVARDGREVSCDALSEGELELLGIVTALAGFETYDVAERTPIILLDEVGGLADENLSRLVEYLADRSRFLAVTAYPENSPFEDHEISPTEWEVVRGADAPSGA